MNQVNNITFITYILNVFCCTIQLLLKNVTIQPINFENTIVCLKESDNHQFKCGGENFLSSTLNTLIVSL